MVKATKKVRSARIKHLSEGALSSLQIVRAGFALGFPCPQQPPEPGVVGTGD